MTATKEQPIVLSGPQSISVFIQHTGKWRISTASMDEIRPGIWWISRVLVEETMRGKGIGSILLQKLIEACLERNPTRIEVAPGGYGSDPKKQANFYVRNGFRQIEEDGLYVYGLLEDLNDVQNKA